MPYCFVPGCRSGYGRKNDGKHFFRLPNDKNQLAKWARVIPQIDTQLTTKRICDQHFSEDLIIKSDCFIVKGEKVEIPRVKWKLKPGAIPHIFLNLSKSTQVKSRKLPTRQKNQISCKKRRNKNEDMCNTDGSIIMASTADESQVQDVDKKFTQTSMEVAEVEPEKETNTFQMHPLNENQTPVIKKEQPMLVTFCVVNVENELNIIKQETSTSRETDPLNTEDSEHSDISHLIKNEIKDEPWDGTTVDEELQDVLSMKFELDSGDNDSSVFSGDLRNCILNEDSIEQYHGRVNVKSKRGKKHLQGNCYRCKTCDKDFSSKSALVAHQRCHKQKQIFKCEICNREFKKKKSFEKHKLSHNNEKNNKMEMCDKDSESNHPVASQVTKKRYTCEICSNTFTLKSSLAKHIVKHSGEKPYRCEICGRAFSWKNSLIDHQLRHSGQKRYKCDLCDKGFIEKQQLVHHVSKHTGLRLHKCETCNKTFSNKSNLVQHQKVHTDLVRFKCDACNKEFKWKQTFLEHQLKHTGEKLFECDLCGKDFIRKDYLVRHKRTHTNIKPFKCESCGRCFNYNSNLLEHRRIHTGLKPYTCEICNRSFSWKHKYMEHQLIHTGQKRYLCEICSKGFIRKQEFDNHMLRHASQKPFKCDTCQKCFSRSTTLSEHQRVHTGDRPYKCTDCGKCYMWRNDLVHHQLSHKNDKS